MDIRLRIFVQVEYDLNQTVVCEDLHYGYEEPLELVPCLPIYKKGHSAHSASTDIKQEQ